MTREEAIKQLENLKGHCEDLAEHGEAPWGNDVKALDMAIKVLEQQKKGKWIPIPFALDYKSDAKCSVCKESFIDAIYYNYCPKCGAEMKGGK